MCKAVIWKIEIKCVAGKDKPPEENGLNLPHQTFTVFIHTKNICESQRGNASKAIDRCRTAIVSRDFKQVENRSHNHALQKRTCQCIHEKRKCICFVSID